MSGRSPQNIHLRWYGRGIGMRMDYTVSWEDNHAGFEEIFNGGMIEISPLDNIAARAFLINGAEEIEITPVPLYMRSFVIRPGLPVEYKIHHTADKRHRSELYFVIRSQSRKKARRVICISRITSFWIKRAEL